MKQKISRCFPARLWCVAVLLIAVASFGQQPKPKPVTKPSPTQIITPTSKPEFAASSDLTQ